MIISDHFLFPNLQSIFYFKCFLYILLYHGCCSNSHCIKVIYPLKFPPDMIYSLRSFSYGIKYLTMATSGLSYANCPLTRASPSWIGTVINDNPSQPKGVIPCVRCHLQYYGMQLHCSCAEQIYCSTGTCNTHTSCCLNHVFRELLGGIRVCGCLNTMFLLFFMSLYVLFWFLLR